MAGSDSQMDKSQRGRPKRAELPDVNINTSAQSINASLKVITCMASKLICSCVVDIWGPSQLQFLSNFYKNVAKVTYIKLQWSEIILALEAKEEFITLIRYA